MTAHTVKRFQRPRLRTRESIVRVLSLGYGQRRLAVLALLLLSGCVGVVTSTPPGSTNETRPVYLLDHGRHATLVLTREDQTLVRYAFGEWRWYAKDQVGPIRAVSTLLLPTESTLGRRLLQPAEDEINLRQQIPVFVQALYTLESPATEIDALDQRLSALFEERAAHSVFNAQWGLTFVPGPRPYTLLHNSNHVIAEWLEALGINVRGNPMFGHWRLERY